MPPIETGPAKCCYCGAPDTEADLRPYGPDGADICFLCATATPERAAAARAAAGALYAACLGVIRVGTVPRPFDPARTRS